MPAARGRGRAKVTTTETPENAELQQFLRLAGERFQRCAEAESSTRAKSLDDVKFSLGEQWHPDVIAEREREKRPILTLNRAEPFLEQVQGNQRQMRPAAQINPVGSGSDRETAEALQGLVRHVEVNSDAEIAYDHAFDWMTRGGFSWWRWTTEYVDDQSFDQELRIDWVEDPFSVYGDPDCSKYDGSDMRYLFAVKDFGEEEYKSQFPNSQAASLDEFSGIGNSGLQFGLGKDRIRVAEYFYVVEEQRTLHLLKDGSSMRDDVHATIYKDPAQMPPGRAIVKSRPLTIRRVKWAKINKIEKLEERDWPGKYIPFVRLQGHSMTVDGKKHISGLIRHFKDAQRMYNYWISAATEKIALDPKAPWMIAEGQDEGYEHEYEVSNRKNLHALHYKPKTVDGQLVPPPSRQVMQSQIDGYVRLIAQADSDMKGITGIYDPSLGQRRADESGKAILALQKQSDQGSFSYGDNLMRSMRHSTRIFLDLAPHIYDSARVQRIIKPDGTPDHVGMFSSKLQGQTAESVEQLEEMQGIRKIYDVGVGRYDVTVSAGPSYASKRQEALASMMNLVSAYPAIFNVIGDLLVDNADWPGAKEIAKRLKRMVPANVLDPDDSSPEAQLQQTQAQLQQISQQHDALVKALDEANELIRTKRLDLESKERIAGISAMAQMTAASLKMHGDAGLELMKIQFAAISKRLELLHAAIGIDQEDGEGGGAGETGVTVSPGQPAQGGVGQPGTAGVPTAEPEGAGQ